MANKDLNIKVTTQTKDAKKNLDDLNQSIAGVGESGQTAHVELQNFTNALASLTLLENSLSKIGQLGTDMVKLGDQYRQLQSRIALYTASQEEASAVMGELAAISQATHAPLEATAELFARLSAATKGTGTSQKELLGFSEAINNALRVSNTSAQAAAGALTQLSQGLGQLTERYKALTSMGAEVTDTLKSMAKAATEQDGAFTKAAASAKLAAENGRAQGEAAVAGAKAQLDLVTATGSLVGALQAKVDLEQAEAKAAQDSALAAQGQLQVTQGRIQQIREQIEGLQALKAHTEEEKKQVEAAITARQQQITQLQELLPKQSAEVQKLQALAQAQAEQARQALIATQTLGDQSAKLGELSLAYSQAQAQLAALNQQIADGNAARTELIELERVLIELELQRQEIILQGAEDMAAHEATIAATRDRIAELKEAVELGSAAEVKLAEQAAKTATAHDLLADSLKDAAAAMRDQQTLAEGQLRIDTQMLDLKKIEVQRRLDVARARGDEKGVQQAQVELAEIEAQKLDLLAQAKQKELELMREKIKLAQMEAELDGVVTAEEQRQIDILEQKARIIDGERQAFEASAAAKRDVTAATQEAIAAEREHAAAANDTADAIAGQADAKAGASKSGGSGSTKIHQNTGYADLNARMAKIYGEWTKSQIGYSTTPMSPAMQQGLDNLFAEAAARDAAKAQQATKSAAEEGERLLSGDSSSSRPKTTPATPATPARTVRFELVDANGKTSSVTTTAETAGGLESWLESMALRGSLWKCGKIYPEIHSI